MSHKQGIGITVGGQRPADTRQILVGAPGPVHALYIHVPFCAHKCHYCDFYSIVDSQDRQGAFTDRLIRELVALAPLAGDRFVLQIPGRLLVFGLDQLAA